MRKRDLTREDLKASLFHAEPGVSIYCGDSRDILPQLVCPNTTYCLEMCDGRCEPHVLVSDPPYGIAHKTDYASRSRCARSRTYPPMYGDDKPFDPAWLLALGWPTILWGANYYASRLPDSSGWLVWDKERPDDLDQATCELAWTNCIKGVRRFRYLWNGMMRAAPEDLVHPTQKPVALMRWVLSLQWLPAGVVVDPYMGSGSTLVAAKDVGRRVIGVEIEPRYCEIAVRRLRQEVLAL
jgi:DNA modification methylase